MPQTLLNSSFSSQLVFGNEFWTILMVRIIKQTQLQKYNFRWSNLLDFAGSSKKSNVGWIYSCWSPWGEPDQTSPNCWLCGLSEKFLKSNFVWAFDWNILHQRLSTELRFKGKLPEKCRFSRRNISHFLLVTRHLRIFLFVFSEKYSFSIGKTAWTISSFARSSLPQDWSCRQTTHFLRFSRHPAY